MVLYSIYIDVIDEAQTPQLAVPINFAESGSIKLIYEGGDDKFSTIMASTLEFSLEVSIEDSNQDLYYDTLFTGNETRFRVKVHNQDGDVLWQGFLLPDEYSEPYKTGTFYPRFTATDGLGRLKGKRLPANFFNAKHSISKILGDCLLQTGLELPIYIEPAILNSSAYKPYDGYYIDASIWRNDNGVNTDCYEILNAVLEMLGCVIYQQEDKWYIQGWNTIGAGTSTFYTYDAAGVYNTTATEITPRGLYLNWNAFPQVTKKPPFKEVSVGYGITESNIVFSEDYFKQSWIKNAVGLDAPFAKKWNGNDTLTPRLYPQGTLEHQEYTDTEIEITSVVGFNLIEGVTEAQKFDNYLSLKEPVFIKDGFKFDLTVVFKYRQENPNYGGFDFVTYTNNNMYYEVLLDSTVIASNRPTFPGADTFLWKKTNEITEDDYLEFTFEASAKNISIAGGYIDLRFFNGETDVSGADNGGSILIENVTLQYRAPFTTEFTKTRTIDFTKTQSVDVFGGDSVLDNVPGAIVVQNLKATSGNGFLFVDYDAIALTLGDIYYGVVLQISEIYYNLISDDDYGVYYVREGSDYVEFIADFLLIESASNGFFIKLHFADGYVPTDKGNFYVHVSNANPQTTLLRLAREQWQKTTGAGVTKRLGEALAEVMHDVYAKSLVTMEGTTKGIVFPRDLVQFEFAKALFKWISSRIEIDFERNQTDVTCLQYVVQEVTDYE